MRKFKITTLIIAFIFIITSCATEVPEIGPEYDPTVFARDLLAEYVRQGGLAK